MKKTVKIISPAAFLAYTCAFFPVLHCINNPNEQKYEKNDTCLLDYEIFYTYREPDAYRAFYDTVVRRTDYTYDNQGKMIEKLKTYHSAQTRGVTEHFSYEYDHLDSLKKEYQYYHDNYDDIEKATGYKVAIHFYSNDPEHRRLKTEHTNQQGKILEYTKYEYSKTGNLLGSISYNLQFKKTGSTKYTYDERDSLLSTASHK